MSTLWKNAAHHMAMPWIQDPEDKTPKTPVSVRHVGFAGVVGSSDEHSLFSNSNYPEATRSERAHLIQHGEWPQRYQDRFSEAAERVRNSRGHEDTPDIEDDRLGHFLDHHWSDPYLWKKTGTLGEVSLHQPIHATQTHVAQEHLNRYRHSSEAPVHNAEERTDMDRVAPMFVKHEGRLHAIEGHHRIGAAMLRGDPSIKGWTFDLDNHYMRGYDDEDHD
jgi:hypothetical protein